MHKILPLLFLLFLTNLNAQDQSAKSSVDSTTPISITAQNTGTFLDTRDGQTYHWIRLKDGKKWMAQNLNFEIEDSWCYDDNPKNCKIYGRLYYWKAAKKACPDGWRLPTDDEWWDMMSHYGKSFNGYSGHEQNKYPDSGKAAYKALVKGGDSRFSALLGGVRSPKGVFQYAKDYGHYWSSTRGVWGYYFSKKKKRITRNFFDEYKARSCRCIEAI